MEKRSLGTSKTGSFALYLSPSIPRPGAEPAVGVISVPAWPSSSLGSRGKDQIKAKPQMGAEMHMLLLSGERVKCELEQLQKRDLAWTM